MVRSSQEVIIATKEGIMELINNAQVQKFQFLGNYQQTLAGADQGLKTLEVWRLSLAPGKEIPASRHEEIPGRKHWFCF